ncbi:hypothetical protein B0T21DRAFT_411371 [Apiosordaria backusii]|uniref:Uncharacterized protein n=1 Tax=Apiosordaria backusii TaxID=314023 RepID=A0AA40BL11_9PEZI|nr:hypothetical protein B0T21DRAFT_411371 [Apiosordaria backusii]
MAVAPSAFNRDPLFFQASASNLEAGEVLSSPRDDTAYAARNKTPGYLRDDETYFVPGWARNLVGDVNRMETTLDDVVKKLHENAEDAAGGRMTSSEILDRWLKSARKVPIPEADTTLVTGTASGKATSPGRPDTSTIPSAATASTKVPNQGIPGREPRTPPRQTWSDPTNFEGSSSTTPKTEPPTHLVLEALRKEIASMKETHERLVHQILEFKRRQPPPAPAPAPPPVSGGSPGTPQPGPTTPARTTTPGNPPASHYTRYYRAKIAGLEAQIAACDEHKKQQQRIIDHLLDGAKTQDKDKTDATKPPTAGLPQGSSETTVHPNNLADTTQLAISQTGNAAPPTTLEDKLRALLGIQPRSGPTEKPGFASTSTQTIANYTTAANYASTATQTSIIALPSGTTALSRKVRSPTGKVLLTAKEQVHRAFRSLRIKLWQFSRSAAFQLDRPMSFETDMQKTSGEQPFCDPQLWDRLTRDQRSHRICELIFVYLWRQILRPGVESFGIDPLPQTEKGWRTLEAEMGLARGGLSSIFYVMFSPLNAPRLTPHVTSRSPSPSPLRTLARAIAPVGERIFRTLSPVIQFEFSRNEQIVRQQIWGICHDAALLKMMFRQVPEKQLKVEVPGVWGDQAGRRKWGEQGFDELTNALPLLEWAHLLDRERLPGRRAIVCVPFGALTLVVDGKKVVLEKAWIVGNSDETHAAVWSSVTKAGEKRKDREEKQGADPKAKQTGTGETPSKATGKRNKQDELREKEKPKESNQRGVVVIDTDDKEEWMSQSSSEHDDFRKDPTWRLGRKPAELSTATSNPQEPSTPTKPQEPPRVTHRSQRPEGSQQGTRPQPDKESAAPAYGAGDKKKKKKKRRKRNSQDDDPNWVPGPDDDEDDTESSTEREEV